MSDAAPSPAFNPKAVLLSFDLENLSDRVESALAVPSGFAVEVVSAIPAGDRAATHRLEELWAMARGWISAVRPTPADLNHHLVDDFPSTADGFTVLLRNAAGVVVGMHGAERCGPGVGETRYLVVEPELRGRGLGRCLKAWQLTTARDVGWRVLQCDLPGDATAGGVRALNLAMGGRLVTSFADPTPDG